MPAANHKQRLHADGSDQFTFRTAWHHILRWDFVLRLCHWFGFHSILAGFARMPPLFRYVLIQPSHHLSSATGAPARIRIAFGR
jgi:hypothetical protein